MAVLSFGLVGESLLDERNGTTVPLDQVSPTHMICHAISQLTSRLGSIDSGSYLQLHLPKYFSPSQL